MPGNSIPFRRWSKKKLRISVTENGEKRSSKKVEKIICDLNTVNQSRNFAGKRLIKGEYAETQTPCGGSR